MLLHGTLQQGDGVLKTINTSTLSVVLFQRGPYVMKDTAAIEACE